MPDKCVSHSYTEALKPCPFCGASAFDDKTIGGKEWVSCSAQYCEASMMEMTREQWNTRHAGPSEREKHMADLLRGWCDTIEVMTPTVGLMAGKFCLHFTAGHGENKHRYGLVVAENSYDDAALNAIMGLLEHSAAAINSTPATDGGNK